MKTTSLFLLASLLFASCGQDAASKKLASDQEAHVTASIKQIYKLGGEKATASFGPLLHEWYQSEVPNTIKLNPRVANIYETHAAILQEVAANGPKLTKAEVISVEQAQGIRSQYKSLVNQSTSNVQELSNLATSGTSMSEAEQLKYVSDLEEKEKHQLALVQYYSRRTAAAIAQKEQKLKHQKYNREMWGHE
ncbi:hypothetical protein [Hymenobacter cavernae]|uniref:Uncharacterized protein n=1 Tax=Hymenobacter cavernae TaxID=2044852 RepID=A0ABQ1UW05_9BACT|nr:hypothetical protein [Hymenobacter cavernae]GGF27193.1 hypothetical protein GCM10011383_43520 [Hymenobacter cavernae]